MIKKIKEFILTLFLGQDHSRPKEELKPALKNQWLNIKKIWNNENYNDFGIERIIRLLLALSLFVFPGLYVKEFFGRFGLLNRKLGVELYVVFKLFLPIIFFKMDLTNNLFIAVISGIMIIETVIYLTALIFLTNEFAKPISYRRSLTNVFINYIQICLDYAIIYSYCNYHIPNFFNKKLTTDIQEIYFSFVTSATVGYGDIFVQNSCGQLLVITQIILFLFFLGLFITYFASKVTDKTYYNSNDKKWQEPLNKCEP